VIKRIGDDREDARSIPECGESEEEEEVQIIIQTFFAARVVARWRGPRDFRVG
jgi:hypothetical protein